MKTKKLLVMKLKLSTMENMQIYVKKNLKSVRWMSFCREFLNSFIMTLKNNVESLSTNLKIQQLIKKIEIKNPTKR